MFFMLILKKIFYGGKSLWFYIYVLIVKCKVWFKYKIEIY